MAKGGRTYNRDARGRFASGGGSDGGGKIRRGAKKPTGGTLPARAKLRGAMARLEEAPSPQRKGAVTRARKGLKAAKTPVRMQLATAGGRIRVSRGGKRRGTNGPQVITPEVMAPDAPGPRRGPRAADRPGSMTSVLRGTLRGLAQADARRIREIEAITGAPVTAPRSAGQGGTASGRRVRDAARSGSVSRALGTALRELAQGDARTIREMEQIARDATPKLSGGSQGSGRKRVSGGGGQRRLPGGRKRKPKS